jgi:AAA+ superfamily predicted ATPase
MQQLITFIKAGYSCIQLVTAEEERAVAAIDNIAHKDLATKKKPEGYDLWSWSVTKGLMDNTGKMVIFNVQKQNPNNGKIEMVPEPDNLGKTKDPVTLLSILPISNVSTRSIIILKDFHMYLKAANPMLIRLLKDTIIWGRQTNRHLIIVGCQLNMQPELEKEIQSIDFPLPSRHELEKVVEGIARSAKQELNGDKEEVIDAMVGLTTNEAADAVSYSVASCKKINPKIIAKIKTDTIRRNGIVELVDTDVALHDIGGLEKYKQHLVSISGTFTKEAREWGLPQPQSIIAVGNPGTGKSMSSMACKTVFNLPLVRVEAGRLFAGLVGESEKNWRTAFSTAKAISPCILWMDEAEGLFRGMESSGQCDGGTTGRVVKAVLQDMQMNSDGVFFIFTSNDIDGFPDPLIDRCDVWAFDLPNKTERESIWSIHIHKRKRKASDYNISKLADKTEGFSGRQIEQAWIKAMTVAYNDKRREPTTEDAEDILKLFIPTSVTMSHQIEKRRARLKNRAQSAS